MTTDVELYEALKYRVEVSPATGTRRYYNSANQLHREDGPQSNGPMALNFGTNTGCCTVKMAPL